MNDKCSLPWLHFLTIASNAGEVNCHAFPLITVRLNMDLGALHEEILGTLDARLCTRSFVTIHNFYEACRLQFQDVLLVKFLGAWFRESTWSLEHFRSEARPDIIQPLYRTP